MSLVRCLTRWFRLAALGGVGLVHGQVVIELPTIGTGEPEPRLERQSRDGGRVDRTQPRAARQPHRGQRSAQGIESKQDAPASDQLATRLSGISGLPEFPASPPPFASILLSSFDGSAASGGVIATSTWVNNVTQGPSEILVGGTARNDNGWGASGLSIDASGMSYLNITAQRNAGHVATKVFLQFEDVNLTPSVFSISSLAFGTDAPTLAQIAIDGWASGFDAARITSWSIGGGGIGTQDFRMSLLEVGFTASAIPEPSTHAAIAGGAVAFLAVWQRRRNRARCAMEGS